jgi:hypothetical protein
MRIYNNNWKFVNDKDLADIKWIIWRWISHYDREKGLHQLPSVRITMKIMKSVQPQCIFCQQRFADSYTWASPLVFNGSRWIKANLAASYNPDVPIAFCDNEKCTKMRIWMKSRPTLLYHPGFNSLVRKDWCPPDEADFLHPLQKKKRKREI